MSSDWPPGKDGVGPGGAGQSRTLPLPPIHRPALAATVVAAAAATAVVDPPPQPHQHQLALQYQQQHQNQQLLLQQQQQQQQQLQLQQQQQQGLDIQTGSVQPRVLRNAVFSKLENLVREMQDSEHGVPVRSQKLFLTSIPAAFMGYDLIEWLMDRLCIEDSPVEAVHLANLLCQFGYYFPVSEQKNLLVKDDSSLYRFQSPYYWPSQHHTPDNIEYAIYLYKRAQRNKKIHGLEPGLPDYENDALNNLKKILASKWEFVTMQAEEQLKVAKDRKKGDKIINDSQEKAYWRVYRPPPGYNTLVENSPVPTREQRVKARRNNKELLREENDYLKQYLDISRVRTSVVAEGLLEYTDTFVDWDPLLVGVGPSNPWMTDDTSYWEINKAIPDVPTEKRVRRWAISLEDIIMDPLGVQELLAYMKKEYSHENLRFWLAVQELKRGPGSDTKIKKKVKEIFDEFLSKGAKAEINIDGKTMEETRIAMKTPSRYTYDKAADHVYLLLLKKDCYPRFIRSEHYKNLLANAINPGSSRKRFFNFPQVRKKASNNQPPNAQGQPGAVGGNGPNPEDFDIYGMDGTVEDDEKALLPDQHLETPRKNRPKTVPCSQESSNEACPWDTKTGHDPGGGGSDKGGAVGGSRSRKFSQASPGPPHDFLPLSDNHVGEQATSDSVEELSQPIQLSPLRSVDGLECWGGQISTDTIVGGQDSSTDPGQVQIDLPSVRSFSPVYERPRKKSNSATSGEGGDDIIIKKTSSGGGESLQCSSVVLTAITAPLGEKWEGSKQTSPGKMRMEQASRQPSSHLSDRDSRGEVIGERQPSTEQDSGVENETGAGGPENGCWISSQDVCPWEDDSLTPTWL